MNTAVASVIEDNKAVLLVESPETDRDLEKEVSSFFKEVQEFEKDRVEMAKRNERRAWKIAGAAIATAFVMAVALACLAPLKQVVPFVIRVDNNTGFADIAKPISNNQTTYGQELDKYWLGQFVVNRESYEWETIQDMYNRVNLLSGPKVFNEYKVNINNKAVSPLYILKKDKKLMVRILSISFIDEVAQVRFIKYVKNANGSVASEYRETAWIATITYDYQHDVNKEAERFVNPLGFQVTSYRVDAENVEVK